MTPEYEQDMQAAHGLRLRDHREMWKQQAASTLGTLLGGPVVGAYLSNQLGNQAYSTREYQLQNDMRNMAAGAFMNESRAGERWERIERYAPNPNWWWRLMTTAWLLGVAGVVFAVWMARAAF